MSLSELKHGELDLVNLIYALNKEKKSLDSYIKIIS